MKVYQPAGKSPATAGGWATLSTAADYSTASTTAVEMDSSLRVPLTVTSSGKVRVRHALIPLGTVAPQDVFTAVSTDGGTTWTPVAAFNETLFDDFGPRYWNFQGEVELTGLAAGSTTFRFGWYTQAGGHAIKCQPNSLNAGMGLGTWQSVVTLP